MGARLDPQSKIPMALNFLWWPLAGLIVLPVLIRLLPVAEHKHSAALHVPFLSALSGQIKRGGTPLWLLGMLWVIWALLILALMRPQWVGGPVNLPTSGRDLLIAVDISGSMNQRDMVLNGNQVSRLAITKHVVADFIVRRQGDRIGLIVFGTQAYLRAPLTFDRKTVGHLLQEIPPVSLAGGKTAIGDAIGLAIKQLSRKETGDRILILLTDGSNTSGEIDPLKAAQLARQEKVRIYTVGVGSDNNSLLTRLPFSSRFFGSSDLDAKTLQSIAKITGGYYFRAETAQDLIKIYERLNEHEPIVQADKPFRPTRSLLHYPLALALVLSMLAAAYLFQSQTKRDDNDQWA